MENGVGPDDGTADDGAADDGASDDGSEAGGAPVPDLTPLALPAAEEALLRLLLEVGRVGTRDAASRLGLSLSRVSNAAGALKDRGFVAAGISRTQGLLLAPLDAALDALVQERRRRAESDLADLERTREALLAVARWRPAWECPHTLVPRDLREWERVERLQEVRDTLDLVVDLHHVNSHVPGSLLRVPKRWSKPTVRLLVTGAADPRPVIVSGRATGVDAARSGIAVRRLAERSAAFSVYDGKRVEVPLWRLEASGWSDEPGEVRAAVRLFALLWGEALTWPTERAVGGAPQMPPQVWPQPSRPRAPDPAPTVVGSAP